MTPDLCAYLFLGLLALALLIWIVASLRRSPYPPLDSALYVNSPESPLYNRASLRRLTDLIYAEQARLDQLNQDAQAWQAPDGQKREHNRRKKEISAQLDKVNAQVQAFELAQPVARSLLDREMHYRIFFTVNGIEFDLAISDSGVETDNQE